MSRIPRFPVITGWYVFLMNLMSNSHWSRTFDRIGLTQVTLSIKCKSGEAVGYDWEDVGYTNRKLTQLKSTYYNEETFSEFLKNLEKRESMSSPFSLGYFLDSGKKKNVQNGGVETMGRCLQTLNLIRDGNMRYCIDVNLRASEVFKALPADLKFICEFLIPQMITTGQKTIPVRFNIAWAVIDPVAVVIPLVIGNRVGYKTKDFLDQVKLSNEVLCKNLRTALRFKSEYGKVKRMKNLIESHPKVYTEVKKWIRSN